jgi:hypothetical protein
MSTFEVRASLRTVLFDCISMFAHFGITNSQEVDLMLTHVGRPEYVIGGGFWIARLNLIPLCAGCFHIGSMKM